MRVMPADGTCCAQGGYKKEGHGCVLLDRSHARALVRVGSLRRPQLCRPASADHAHGVLVRQ